MMRPVKILLEMAATAVVILLIVGEAESMAITILMKVAALAALGGVAVHYWRKDKQRPQGR